MSILSAFAVISATDGSPVAFWSLSASNSMWEYANRPAETTHLITSFWDSDSLPQKIYKKTKDMADLKTLLWAILPKTYWSSIIGFKIQHTINSLSNWLWNVTAEQQFPVFSKPIVNNVYILSLIKLFSISNYFFCMIN